MESLRKGEGGRELLQRGEKQEGEGKRDTL
jgi:hypothetical protein